MSRVAAAIALPLAARIAANAAGEVGQSWSDCSEFAAGVLETSGVPVDRPTFFTGNARSRLENAEFAQTTDLAPGDVVLFEKTNPDRPRGTPSHMAIVTKVVNGTAVAVHQGSSQGVVTTFEITPGDPSRSSRLTSKLTASEAFLAAYRPPPTVPVDRTPTKTGSQGASGPNEPRRQTSVEPEPESTRPDTASVEDWRCTAARAELGRLKSKADKARPKLGVSPGLSPYYVLDSPRDRDSWLDARHLARSTCNDGGKP